MMLGSKTDLARAVESSPAIKYYIFTSQDPEGDLGLEWERKPILMEAMITEMPKVRLDELTPLQ
jgi:hypothetical protein